MATFTEAILQVPARRWTTTRLRTQMVCDIGDAARSVIEVAAVRGRPGRPHIAAFIAHADAVLGDPAPGECPALTRPAAVSCAGPRPGQRPLGAYRPP